MKRKIFRRKVSVPKYLRGYLDVGPGGIQCPCCFEAPGKARVKAFRTAKRRERRVWKKDTEA